MLSLGSSLSRPSISKKSIVKDNLLLRHDYTNHGVHQVSTGAAYFDGDDYIETADFQSTIQGSFTWSFWIKADDGHPAADDIILGVQGSSSADVFRLLIHSPGGDSGKITVDHHSNNDPVAYKTNSAVFSDGINDWKHIAIVVGFKEGSDTDYKIYVDGVEEAGTATNALSSGNHKIFGSNSKPIYIGGHNNNGTLESPFAGYICNVGIWSRVLSQEEIKSIMWKKYAELTSDEKSSMVSWWNLDSVIASTTTGVHYVYDNHFGDGDELGSELSPNVNFDSDIVGWDDYSSGTASYDSSAKALKLTNNGTNQWMGKTTDNIAGIAANSKYLVTGRVYIPTGWSGGDIHFEEGGSLVGAGEEGHIKADEENLDTWQDMKIVVDTASDTGGRIYIKSQSTPDDGDYILVDSISIKKINGNPGKLQ